MLKSLHFTPRPKEVRQRFIQVSKRSCYYFLAKCGEWIGGRWGWRCMSWKEPPFICWNPNPQCGSTRMRGIREVSGSWGKSPQNRINDLIKETPLPLLPCEDTARGLGTREWALIRHRICQHLGLERPRLWNYEKSVSIIKATKSMEFSLQPEWVKTVYIWRKFSKKWQEEAAVGHKELYQWHNLKNLMNQRGARGEACRIIPKFLPWVPWWTLAPLIRQRMK